MTFPDEEVSNKVEINGKGADKVAIKRMIADKMAIMKEVGVDKVPTNAEIGDKGLYYRQNGRYCSVFGKCPRMM